jgi:putative ABC transport system permease protein
MKSRPPKLAEKILSRLQYDDVWKTTLGDFEEYYSYLVKKEGVKGANKWYWQQVIRYAPSKIIHKIYWGIAMFKNYLKISLRNLNRHKSYSLINIIGLSIGLAGFVLIGLFVNYELSFDSFHNKSERTYRVVAQQPANEYMGSNWYAVTAAAMAATLKEDYPEVEHSAYFNLSQSLLNTDNSSFIERGLATEGDFFEVFTYRSLYGNLNNALNDPKSIVLTKTLSNKIFGNANPIGKTITQSYSNGSSSLKTVTGVISDPPKNSHFSFSYIINAQTVPYYKYNYAEWSNSNEYTFVTLRSDAVAEDFEKKLPGFSEKYIGASDYYKARPDQLPILKMQRLEDIHLHSAYLNFNPSKTGDVKYVYMFSAIALIILLIACVNYMNLATAQSLKRTKEIGVRKVVGAYRSNLIMQFVSESTVISLFSIIISFLLVALLVPVFNNLIERELSLDIFLNIESIGLMVLLSLIVGIVSGSYPAFFLSKLMPSSILKKESKSGRRSSLLRNTLVIAQFSITTVLIVASLVVYFQLNYIKTTDTGLERDQIISISSSDPELWDRYEVLESELLKIPAVEQVSSSQFEPILMSSRTTVSNWEGANEGQELKIYISPVNYNFIDMFDIEVIKGRSFDKEKTKSTQKSYLLNQAAVKELGWTNEQAIGKSFEAWGNPGTIVGIVRDFNFLSLHEEISPLTIMLAPDFNHRYVLAKIKQENTNQTISSLKDVFEELSSNFPFSYTFVDESFNDMYRADLKMGSLFNYFSMLALLIACLGLFGLATFVTEQRTKEIGIRKVLGANIFQILSLLNKDFLKLVGLGFLIASPIGWFLANQWLQNFAFRITVGPSIFIAAGIIVFLIAIVTVTIKSFNSAKANPVKSLKSE